MYRFRCYERILLTDITENTLKTFKNSDDYSLHVVYDV